MIILRQKSVSLLFLKNLSKKSKCCGFAITQAADKTKEIPGKE